MSDRQAQLYTTQEAAASIGISDSRLRGLIMLGEAHPARQIGGTNMFSQEEIDRLRSKPWRKRKDE